MLPAALSVLGHNWPWFWPCFCHLLGRIYSCIQLFLLKRVGNGRYKYPPHPPPTPDSNDHSYHYSPNCICIRSVVRSPDHLRDPIAYLTPLAFILQQSYIDVRYIASFNEFASHTVCFGYCEFRTNTFPYAIISQQSKSFVGCKNILSLLLVCQLWKDLYIVYMISLNPFVLYKF